MIKISQATIEDLETILALQHHVFGLEAERAGNYELPAYTQDMAGIRADFAKAGILKAEQDGMIIGSVRGEIKDGSLLITKLMVHPDARRRGLGGRLIEELERRSGAARFELYTPSTATNNIRLYQGLGYKIYGEREHHSGATFVLMEKFC